MTKRLQHNFRSNIDKVPAIVQSDHKFLHVRLSPLVSQWHSEAIVATNPNERSDFLCAAQRGIGYM